jgi:signal transduction histidine kinase
MMQQLENHGFHSSRIYSDPEGRKTLGLMLKTMLLVVIAIIPVLIFLRYLNFKSFSPTDAALVSLMAAFVASYFFLRRGYLLSVSLFFIVAGWSAITFMAARSAGIRDVSIFGYVLLIFLATLFIGYRFAIIISVLSLLSAWIMALAEYKNILIPYKDLPLEYARDFTVFFILFTTAVVVFEASFRYSFNRINKELQERIKAEEKLSANERILIESNEELLKAKLKAEESDRLKTAFLQNISHEIRTPMNGIIGFSELLRDSATDDTGKIDYLQQMSSCTFQLASLVNDLIEISKIEAGDIEISLSDFSAGDIIMKGSTLFKGNANKKGLDLIFGDETNKEVFRSDEGKIWQIVNSLIDNAIKFTSGGSVKVTICTKNNNLVIAVQDTGIGISKDNLNLVFDRFRQAEMGLSRQYGGTGLGLAIANGLAVFMKGAITVDSEPGEGSLFTLSIPVEFPGLTV